LENFIRKDGKGKSVRLQLAFTVYQFTTRTDALVYKPWSDSYDLYEIKSSTTTKPEFIIDTAFQYLIVEKQIKINRAFVLHLNIQWVGLS